MCSLTILSCPYCKGHWETQLEAKDYESCPLCGSSFNFGKPSVCYSGSYVTMAELKGLDCAVKDNKVSEMLMTVLRTANNSSIPAWKQLYDKLPLKIKVWYRAQIKLEEAELARQEQEKANAVKAILAKLSMQDYKLLQEHFKNS